MGGWIMNEQWLPVDGFPGYEISDKGRVRSSRSRWMTAEPHILAATPNHHGYPQVLLYVGRHRVTRRVHILVAYAFIGPCPAGQEVRHLDGDKLNAAKENLAYGTHAENVADSVRHGTHAEAVKTHCPAGHPYDEENTYVRPDGRGRQCIPCMRAVSRRRRLARRSAAVS